MSTGRYFNLRCAQSARGAGNEADRKMALIIRIDVDRPYGRKPLLRHILSRLSSDVYFPTIESLGYLRELGIILRMLNERKARAHVFFRRCTLPSPGILGLIGKGGHEIGLHLENSRSLDTFVAEKKVLEAHTGRSITAVSKHGSGVFKYGLHHYAPYEPEKYIDWAQQIGLKLFLGNLEDPSIRPSTDATGFLAYPSAFWLEPEWRNTKVFTIDWLQSEASLRDIVLLIHPENVLSSPALTTDFERLLSSVDTTLVK
jgi:peptidoglycan/xylan/chitin deacetylase (PgdA/CDA1 family)